MLPTRFTAAAAVMLFVSGLAAGHAAAQSATNETPGKPLQLLRIVEQPAPSKTRSHTKKLSKHIGRTHTAIARREAAPPAQMADATPPANPVPAASPRPAPNAPVTDLAPAPPAAAVGLPAPNELVVSGQTVQVTSPDTVNEIDLAANTTTGAPVDAAAPATTAAIPPATNDAAPSAEPLLKSDLLTADKAPSDASASAGQASAVGSTSWILQVLAALGGAVTAGSVAWFMIGSTPQRTYG